MIVRSRDQKSAHRGFGRGALYLGGGACLLLVRSFFKLHGLCPFLPPGFACTPVTGSRVMRGCSAEPPACGCARHKARRRSRIEVSGADPPVAVGPGGGGGGGGALHAAAPSKDQAATPCRRPRLDLGAARDFDCSGLLLAHRLDRPLVG